MTYARTVAELLGIELTVEPARYDIGNEPAEAPSPQPRRRRASPLDRRRVSAFYEAARGGAPDADIARAAGVTVAQVRGWRLRLRILRKPGATRISKIHGALLGTPELVQALREFGSVDGGPAPEPRPVIRFSDEEVTSLLEARGLGHRQGRDTMFHERASVRFMSRSR